MDQKIDCGFGILDASEYPVISVTMNETPPSAEQIDFFLDEYIKIIKRTTGRFLLIIDVTLATKMPVDARESMAIGLQFLEGEYIGRYLRNVLIVNKISLIIIIQLVKIVIRPVVKQKMFMKKHKAYSYAYKLIKETS